MTRNIDKILITYILLTLTTPILAASGRLSFLSPSYNFGTVHRGEQVTFEFPFKNIGTENVIIEGVFAACGCITVNKLVGQMFYPGDSGVLRVDFDSQRFEGKIHKKIVIATNSKGITSHTLSINGTVESTININPPVLAFGAVVHNSKKTLTATINVKNSFELKDLQLKFDSKKMDVSLQKSELQKNVIVVSILDTSRIGLFKEVVTLLTNHPIQKEVKLLVRAEIVNSIVSSKKYIEFGAINEEGQSQQSLILSGIEDIDDLEPSSELYIDGKLISENSHLMDVSTLSANRSDGQEIKVSLNRTASTSQKFKGPITGYLNFKSKSKNEELKIPVYGYFF